jgi:hypothetical protein
LRSHAIPVLLGRTMVVAALSKITAISTGETVLLSCL